MILKILEKMNHSSNDELVAMLNSKPDSLNEIKELWQIYKEKSGSSWTIASCCTPLPGDNDAIVAVGKPALLDKISTVKETDNLEKLKLLIHRSNCQLIKDIPPDHVKEISWSILDTKDQKCDHCLGSLLIETYDLPGTLQSVLIELAKNNICVDIRNVTNHANQTSTIYLLIPVSSRCELISIKDQILKSDGVKVVEWKRIKTAT